jgi:hypothetical protein
MLFDLRGSGRRNTVRVIYLGLAVLMGGGLVLFGIGGNVGGGLLDSIKNGGGGNSGATFTKRINNLEKKVRLDPKDAAAWAQLAKLQTQEASANSTSDQTSGTLVYNDTGKAQLNAAASSWDRYVALNPKKPDLDLAKIMVFAFAPGALNKPDKAVAAEEMITENGKPNAGDYRQLAFLAYAAGQTRKGDLSAAKAISLTKGKAAKKTLKQQFDGYKAQLAQQQIQQAQTNATTTP